MRRPVVVSLILALLACWTLSLMVARVARADGPLDTSEVVRGADADDSSDEPITVGPAGENDKYPNVGRLDYLTPAVTTFQQPAYKTINSVTLGPIHAPDGCPTTVNVSLTIVDATNGLTVGGSNGSALIAPFPRKISWDLKDPVTLIYGHSYNYYLAFDGISSGLETDDTRNCGDALSITTYPIINRPNPNDDACVEMPDGGGINHRHPAYPNVIYRVWMKMPPDPHSNDPFEGQVLDADVPSRICAQHLKVGQVPDGNGWGYVADSVSGTKNLIVPNGVARGAPTREAALAIAQRRQCDDMPPGIVFHDWMTSGQVSMTGIFYDATIRHKCDFIRFPSAKDKPGDDLPPGQFIANPDNLGMPKADGTRDDGIQQIPDLALSPAHAFMGSRDVREFLGTANPANAKMPRCDGGDPVNCITGNFYEDYTDLTIPGRGTDLSVTRSYNSLAAASGYIGVFGRGWNSALDSRVDAVAGGSGSVTVTHGNGSTVTFAWDGTKYVAPNWARSKLTKLANGNYRYTLPTHEVYEYAAAGQLLTATDQNGNTETLTWNGTKLSKITGGGRTITVVYSGSHISGVSDGTGRFVSYYYTGDDLTSVRDVLGGRMYFTSNAGLLTTVRNQLGDTVVTNTYDPTTKQVVKQTDANGKSTTWEYTQTYTGSTTTVTDRDGRVAVHRFVNMMPASTTLASGTSDAETTSTVYNTSGELKRVIDPAGHPTRYSYDTRGNVVRQTDAEGRVTTWEYTADDRPSKQTTASGRITDLAYDAAGNLISVTLHGPGTGLAKEARTYDTYGQLLSVTNVVNNRQTHYTYDAVGNLIKEESPGGRVTTHDYDARGYVTTTTLPAGNVAGGTPTSWQIKNNGLNMLGQPSNVTDQVGAVTAFTYNALGNVTSTTDPDGRVTTTSYDPLERVTQVTRPDGGIDKWSYSDEGDLLSQTNGLGKVTSWHYDALHRADRKTDPLGRLTKSTYDLVGDVIALEDPNGNGPRYSYDDTGRLTHSSNTAGTPGPIDYAYDADGNMTRADGNGDTVTMSYDDFGRLTRRSYANGQETRLNWDDGGDLLSIAYPDGADQDSVAGSTVRKETFGTVSYTYDAEGLMTKAKDWANREFSFTYDANGNLQRANYPTGAAAYTRDKAGRPTSITTPVGNRGYTYTPAGVPKTWWNIGTPSNALSVDGALHLTQFGSQTSAFDLAEQPTALTEPNGAAVTQTFDVAGQMLSRTSGGVASSFNYDVNGDRTSETTAGSTTAQYNYDGLGRLTGYSGKTRAGAAFTAGYAYGAEGNRRFESRDGLTQYDVWEDELGDAAPLLTHGRDAYVYGPDGMALERVAQGGSAKFLWQDKIGSIIGATSTSGATLAAYGYSPWGQRTSGDDSVAGVLGFAGQVTEPGSDLQYMRARWYDPKSAQFITRDPLEAETGQPYVYASGNPTMFTDPTGENIFGDAARGARDFAGGAMNALTLGHYKPGWANSCSWLYFGGQAVGGGIDPLKKVEAVGIGASAIVRGRAVRNDAHAVEVVVDKAKYPQSARHIEDAQNAGHPSVLTVDRSGAAARRRAAQRGTPTKSGLDRDEYPPAMTSEGGAGSSVRHIDPGDNRGAGASIGAQCRSVPDGARIRVVCR